MNKDDDLLRELGAMARDEAESERARWDERWDRLAAGTLSAGEDAELRRLAATSTEATEAYEAFRPLGPEFHASVAAAIARQAREEAELSAAAGPATTTASAATPGPRVLPFRGSVRRLAAWGAGMGAATAAMVAMVIRLLAPPLPVYTMADLAGGHRMTRGELVEAPRFAPGDRFETVLTPKTAVERASKLGIEACVQRGEELRPLAVESDIDPTGGAVRVQGTLDRDLPPGRWTLWVVVGRPRSLPDLAELRTLPADRPTRQRNWVALPETLLVQPRSPD
jgi:hypothetical protein